VCVGLVYFMSACSNKGQDNFQMINYKEMDVVVAQ
jgi:hypothetical protein